MGSTNNDQPQQQHTLPPYPAFCAVHMNNESQPLLGYQAQTTVHNGDYYVGIPTEEEGYLNEKGLPITTNDTDSNNNTNKRCCRRGGKCNKPPCGKILKRILGVLLIGWLLCGFFGDHQDDHSYNRHRHHRQHDHQKGVTHDASSGSYGMPCQDNAISWEEPSLFSTEAKNFKLKIGKGNLGARIEVLASADVSEPTLQIYGEVTPKDNEEAVVEHTKSDNVIHVERQGVRIEIRETDDLFDALVFFEDWQAKDPRTGRPYRACANLDISILVPESFTAYGHLTVEGQVGGVHVVDLGQVGFDRLDLSTVTGSITAVDTLKADIVNLSTVTGRIDVEETRVKTEGKPLKVKAESNTGRVQLVGIAGSIEGGHSDDADKEHSVDLKTKTGAIHSSVFTAHSNPGSLSVRTLTDTGAISSTVQPSDNDESQGATFLDRLILEAKTSVGAVNVQISDLYQGRFEIGSKLGRVTLEPKAGSESEIAYDKNTASVKAGLKRVEGGDEGESQIFASSSVGRVTLEFV